MTYSEDKITAVLTADANLVSLPADMLARIKREAAREGAPAVPVLRPARNRRRLSTRTLIATVALAACATAGAIFLPSVLAPEKNVVMAMEKAVDRLHTYHGILNDGTEIWRDGEKFAIRRPDGTMVISDGTAMWEVDPKAKTVRKDVPTAAELMVQPNLRYRAALARSLKHKVVGQETVAGRKAYKLEITHQAGAVEHLWIDQETDLPIQWEEDGLVTFTTFEANPKIGADTFTYTTPADYAVQDLGRRIVATVDEAAATAGFRPVLPTERPIRIVVRAEDGEVVLDYGDVRIAQRKATAPLQMNGWSAYGVAAGGPLEVQDQSLYWQQDGARIYISTHPQYEERMLALARQIAPDLQLPDPRQDLVSAAKVAVTPDLEKVKELQAKYDRRDDAVANSYADADNVALIFARDLLGVAPGEAGAQVVANTGVQAVVRLAGGPAERIYLQKLIYTDTQGIWTVVGYDPR